MSHDSSRPPKVSSSRRRKTAPSGSASGESEGLAESIPGIAPLDAARYIGEMTAELARFARRHDHSTLAYFLEMAGASPSERSSPGGDERHCISAVPLEPAGELEFQQRGLDDPDGEPRLASDVVDRHWSGAEEVHDPG